MKIQSQIPNIFTLLNLLSGCIAVLFIFKNDFITAFLFLFIGISFDFFDGFLARLLKVESPLGVQLDSLADMVTSGLVPGITMVFLLRKSLVDSEFQNISFEYFSWIGFLITLASCYRLAVFNISTNQSSSFVGLPTPSSALVVLSIGMIIQLNEIEWLTQLFSTKSFLVFITFLLSYLMNSKINLFALKFKSFGFKANKLQFLYLFLTVILLIFLQRNAVPFIIFSYILLSLLFLEKMKPVPKSRFYLFLVFFVLVLLWTNKEKIFNLTKHPISASFQAHHSKIFELHQENSFGIDVSEYQNHIYWHQLKTIEDKVTIDFVVIRATVGKDKVDEKFRKNWKQATKHSFIKGAYHYYRPNENSIEQANNFIKNVKLSKGDFPPILDIEKLPKTQSIDSLKVGLKRWLDKVEKHYGVQPIIYSGESYYNNFLHEEFSQYKFWIANYNLDQESHHNNCLIWQFSENGNANGINTPIDLNVFNGNLNQLKKILMD